VLQASRGSVVTTSMCPFAQQGRTAVRTGEPGDQLRPAREVEAVRYVGMASHRRSRRLLELRRCTAGLKPRRQKPLDALDVPSGSIRLPCRGVVADQPLQEIDELVLPRGDVIADALLLVASGQRLSARPRCSRSPVTCLDHVVANHCSVRPAR